MTTRNFIAKTYNTTSDKDRQCSSVFTDRTGTVYSYGYHYPLLFKVAGLNFINTEGYSNTTARHISWAWQAVNYDAIPVKLWRADALVISRASLSTDVEKLTAIKTALEREVSELIQLRSSKKRKDTQVYYNIERDLHKARVNYLRVLACLSEEAA